MNEIGAASSTLPIVNGVMLGPRIVARAPRMRCPACDGRSMRDRSHTDDGRGFTWVRGLRHIGPNAGLEVLAGAVKSVIDRLSIRGGDEEDALLKEPAVCDSSGSAEVGEGKRFLGQVEFQEEILSAEFIAEIWPPDHVETGAAPGALRLLGGVTSDKTAKGSKKVDRGGEFRHGSSRMGLIKCEIGFDRHGVAFPSLYHE